MKSILPAVRVCSALLAALTVARAAAAQGANCNLAPNPAFEQGTSASISSWVFAVKTGSATFSVSTFPSPVQSGTRAAQIVVTTPGDLYLASTEPGTIPVQKNTTYRMSVRVSSSPGKVADLRVVEWNGGTMVADDLVANSTGLGDWETVSGTVTTGASTTAVSLRLSHRTSRSTGTFVWDDVMFARNDAQRCIDIRHYVAQTMPGYKLCIDGSAPSTCHGAVKTAGKELLRQQVAWDGSKYTSQGYDYNTHTLASRAMVGVQKNGGGSSWQCYSNVDEQCGAARTSPGQNAQYAPGDVEISLTLPVLSPSLPLAPGHTSGAALIHDWQRFAVRPFDPKTFQSTGLVGNIWHREWMYVIPAYAFGGTGTIGTQNDVLVIEGDSIGDIASPYGFAGGAHFERYIFARGFGVIYQEGERNDNCSALPTAAACDGTYSRPDPGIAVFAHRVAGAIPIQDPLDPANTGAGSFTIVDWW
jgi:hypothetical protein